MIRTVLGDIKKEELGITMAHEHFILDLDHVRHDGISMIETIQEVEPEILKMMALGVNSAVEVSTIDMYRDVLKLKQISLDTGLKIVASTGYYLSEYHDDFIKNATIEEIADVFIKELTQGIDNTGIKAGIIAEIASSPKGFVNEELKVLKAASLAAYKTGSAISTHTGRYTSLETIQTILSYGVNPDKVIIGHQDLIDDQEYHKELLSYGVNIAFDTCGKSAYMKDETRAKNALNIIEEGYGDHLVLSNDISRRTYFTSYNQNGYLSVMNIMVPLLKEYGIKDTDLDKLLIHNIARILDNDWR